MAKLISVQCASGERTVPVIWQGETLAVHHPITKNGTPSTLPRWWAISHKPSGRMACPPLDVAKPVAIALARLWDAEFANIPASGANGWPLAKRWLDDVNRAGRDRPLIGPRELTPLERLDSAGNYDEVAAAVRGAMGYEPAPEPDASKQFPAEVTIKTTGSGAIRRNPDSGELEFWWLPRGGNYSEPDAFALAGWYSVPSLGDVEDWCLDSVSETPCGDAVESDHPDAWPRLLGLI